MCGPGSWHGGAHPRRVWRTAYPRALAHGTGDCCISGGRESRQGKGKRAGIRVHCAGWLRVQGSEWGGKTSCLSPLSLLLCFFSPAGSRAGFPSRVTTRVLGILEAVYSTAAWRKGEKKQPVPRVESSGDWWRMTSRLPHPLASGRAQSPPGLFAPHVSGCIPQICVQ